jgi:hypothetical protein
LHIYASSSLHHGISNACQAGNFAKAGAAAAFACIRRGKLSVIRGGGLRSVCGPTIARQRFETFCNVVLVLILNRKTRGCPCGCVTSFHETGNEYRKKC